MLLLLIIQERKRINLTYVFILNLKFALCRCGSSIKNKFNSHLNAEAAVSSQKRAWTWDIFSHWIWIFLLECVVQVSKINSNLTSTRSSSSQSQWILPSFFSVNLYGKKLILFESCLWVTLWTDFVNPPLSDAKVFQSKQICCSAVSEVW